MIHIIGRIITAGRTVVLTIPSSEANSLTEELRDRTVVFCIIFWFVVSAIGWGIASQIVHPLTRTSQIADQLMRDNERLNDTLSKQELELPGDGVAMMGLPSGEFNKDKDNFYRQFN